MEWAKNLFQMFDIFSAWATIYEQRKTDLWELEVERNARWEFRWFSNWKSINFETGEIKDANWNQINFEDLTAEELKELWSMYNSIVSEAVSNNSRSTNPQDRAQQTWIKSNNITDVINNRAVNWMITSEMAANLQWSANKWVRANWIWIIDQLNETTKEYTNSIINNFTVDEINNSTQLQQEIMNSLSAYSNLFNWVADIINNMSDDEYNDVYRFKKAMTASYNVLSDSDKNLIDDNLYKKSINYNNKLETWIDEAWMRSATWVKRATDTILDVLWTKDTNKWYDQWLAWIAWSLVNPELASRWTAWAEISNWLRQNSAYAVDMVIFNRINDKVVEKFVGNKFKDAIRNNPRLNTKKFNAIKWAATEVSSEFLENFTDAISMVDDPNTDYNWVAWLMFGMFQGALAWYASATDSYTSFKDYMSRPENRELILNNMWIYINNIKKPEERAKVLSVVSQLMDDKSPNNLINTIQKTAWNVNNWVESYMQWYALYQINRMVSNHINNMMNQVFDDLAQKWEAWNEDDIRQYFASDSDQTWMTEFKKFQSWQQFELNKNYVNSIINSEDNRKETERIAKNSEAYIRASFEVNWMTLEEAINYMAPKIDTKWEKVITPLNNIKTVEKEMMNKMTWDPVKDIVTVFTATWEVSKTIWDKLWITSDNDNVFWERKSRLWKKSIWYKNAIKVKTVDKDWNEKEETLTMLQYLQRQLDPEVNDQLDNEERIFIATVMFWTSVSWINNYFNDDWSLTKLWEDFLEQVMPTLYERTATKNFRKTMQTISTLKSVYYQKSKTDAVNKSWANVTIKNSITVWWAPVTDWSDIKDISDDTPTWIKVNWRNKTIWELKEKPVVIIKDWIKYSVYVDENNKLRIIQMEDQQQQTETQLQQQEQVKQQKVENPDNIKTYWSKYVLDNMNGQESIKDMYWYKVKWIRRSDITFDDIDENKLDLPPEWIDFMTYHDSYWRHFIVDKYWNIYRVSEWLWDYDAFFKEWIIRKWDEWYDNDIIEWLEMYNSNFKTYWWTLKRTYNEYLKDKNRVLEWGHPNRRKLHKDFVDFIESKNQSNETESEEDNIWTLEEWAFDTVEETNTDPITQDTIIPVSVFAEDYKELEWKLTPVETMLEKWDNIKSYIPYIARSKDLAWVQLFDYSKIANFHPNNVWDINMSAVKIEELNKWIWIDKLPIVSVKENWEWHDYSMIWLWDADITDLNWWTELWFNRHTEFKSMILVDFKAWEQIKKFVQNTIRPAKFKKDKLEKYKYCYYKNNIAYQITTKEWEPINQNRVISFTKSETFDKNWNPTVERYLSTLLQLERLAPNDQSLAFKNKRVFMSSAPVWKRSEWRLFRWWKDDDFKIEYDSRPIFTTSDVVFNNNNTAIKINWLTIDISKKNYDAVLDDSWELSATRWEKTDINTLQKWFNFLWDKWKTMTPKWFVEGEQKATEEWESDKILDKVVQDMPEHKSAKEVEKEFKDAVNAQNNNVETVKEYADSKVTPATESTEETVLKEKQSTYSDQQSLFWWPSLNDIKEELKNKINQRINDINNEVKSVEDARERIYEINNEIKNITKDFKKNKDKYSDEQRKQLQINTLNLQEEQFKLKDLVKNARNEDDIEEELSDLQDELESVDTLDANWVFELAWKYNVFKTIQNKISQKDFNNNIKSDKENQQEQTILDKTTPQNIPSTNQIVAMSSASNETVAEQNLWDPNLVKALVEDCKDLWIVLDSLEPEVLWQVINAYKNWNWIDDVLKYFASLMPWSYVDNKILELLIEKWIVTDQRYNWLTLSEIIAFNYAKKKIANWDIEYILKNWISELWYNWHIIWINDYNQSDLFNILSDYYIRNYFNLDPTKVSTNFKTRFKTILKESLLESNIVVHEEDKINPLLKKEDDPATILELERLLHEDSSLVQWFAYQAYKNWLISARLYNYLMDSNSDLLVIWEEWKDYNLWPIAFSILESVNLIPEIWDIIWDWANKNKLQLLFDVYNYFWLTKKCTYTWLVEYLNKKYESLPQDHIMRQLINVLDKDSKRVWVLYHSNWIIDSLQKNYSQDEKRTWETLYKSFVKDVSDDQSIEDALKILEAEDSDRFIQIAAWIPTNIKKNLLKDFKEDNKQDRSMNIAYRMVSFLLSDNTKVASDLKQENNKNLPAVSWDTEKILKSFSPASLINAEVTKSLYKKFWLYWLDLNKWTVILTNNRQPSLWKYMDNFENVESFPIMPVSSLDEVSLDVNVIVPNDVSIPDNYKWNNDYNIIRVPYAWYADWQLVVKKIWSETKDREDRAYNNLWLYWIWVNLIDWFKLSDENKKVILQNKNLKSMYWEIFKNNILPNIDEKNKNITQDDFEEYIVDGSIETLDNKILFKCFAANDIQNIIDNSISVINHVTNWQLALKSNNESCKNSIKTNRAIEQFAKYIKDKPISNNQKESLINMFDWFLVAQMQLWDIDLVKWFDNFRKEHKWAIQLLYSFPEIKSSANNASSLYQLFVNATNTNERSERALDLRAMNFTNASEKDISDIEKKIDTVRKNLEWLYLSDTQDENRIAILEKYLSELIDERDNMLWLTDEEKYNNDRFIEIYNPESWATVERDYDQFQESSLESEEASSEDKAYTDKTLKVLNVIYKSYIEPNRYTQSPREIASRRTDVVSTWLLWIITWENTFSNEYWNFNVWEETSNKYVFTSQNLTTLIQTLASLKQTNQKRYWQMIDSMFNTLKDVLFTAQKNDANSNLIKIKDQVYNNPFDLYKLYWAISRDPLYSISFKTWWKIEKNVEYKEVQTKALLQSASNEYLTTSPYINNTENWITSMNENVEEYHRLYDKYFENFIPKWSKASDEQVKAFAKIADAFNNRKNPWTYVDKDKVFALPGKAWTWKSTLELAFFKYVNEQWWAEYEIDNIINEKQTSLIYNFKIQEWSIWGKDGKYKKWKFATSNNNDKFYARIYNKDEYWNIVSEIYIEFNWWDNLINYNQLKDMSIDDILDWYSNIWDNNKRVAASALAQTNKYAEEWENFIRNAYADNTWKIKKFTVLDKKPEWVYVIDIVWRWPVIIPADKTDQKFEHVHINKALSDIYFAVRTHKTVSSLIDIATKNWKEKFSWIHYWTEASYLEQDSSAEMSLLWYWHAPKVKDKVKEMTWNIIFIDESQNSYWSDLQAIVEQLWWQNVIVLLWDWHQETKSDYFESLWKWDDYMIESHRATNDINDMNEINSFTQKSSTQSNVIWYYMVDSDDYVRYENINPDWYKWKPKEYVMVTVKNNTRRKLNDDYLEALWAKIDRTEKWDLKSSDLKKIIDNWTTLQVMVIDILSDQKWNKEWRKSEIPNEWLNMKWFQSKDWWKYYVKEDWKKIQIFFPSTKETDASDKKWYIRKVEDSYEKEWKKNWKEIELFVPAFAITTEKESWMTVDNIIIHDEVVNVDYDYFSKQNVKRFYDAFTRWAKKVFIPKYAPRLVWLTREDVHALMNWKPLEKAYIEKTDNKNEMENFVLPVISLRKKWWLEILDDIQTLLNVIWYDNYKEFLPIDFVNNIYTLSSYDLWTQTYADYDYEWEDYKKNNLDIEKLKKSIADDWDRYRNNITRYVDSDQLEKIVKKIDRVIYWFNYLIPKITIEWKEILLDWKNWTTNKVIRWDPRYRNRIFTIKDLENEINEVKRSWLIQFVPYEPDFKDVNWQRMLVLKSFSPKTVKKVKPWWIDLNDQRKLSVIKLDAEKMKIEKIFNYQFDNNKISNKWFNLYDYESWVYPWTDYSINNVQDNEWTIFEPLDQSNLLENEKQELKNKFWEELDKLVETNINKLSDDDLFFTPMINTSNTIKTQIWKEVLSPTWKVAFVNWEYINWKRTNDYYIQERISDVFNIKEWNLSEAIRDRLPIRKFYTTRTIDEKEDTAINKTYKAIKWIIENRDESNLDQLKSMIYNFVERVNAINNWETTPWLDMSENEDKNIWINENQLWDDFDDAQNCEW